MNLRGRSSLRLPVRIPVSRFASIPPQYTMLSLYLLTILSWCAASWAAPQHTNDVSVSIVDTIEDTVNLENIAVRRNGDVLVTSVSSSTIFQVSTKNSYPPVAVAQIPSRNATLGIVELEQDIFYVAAADISGSGGSENEIWKLDMRSLRLTEFGKVKHPATLTLSAKVPNAGLLNGMTRLAGIDNTHILVADSNGGNVIRVNVRTGKVAVVQQHPTMSTIVGELGVGINGIHTFGNNLYYTNLDQKLFARVPISVSDGTATGDVDVISNGTLLNADDFALSRDGTTAWITENGGNALIEVDILSKTTRVAVNSTLLTSISSVAFGRTWSDWNALYVTGALLDNGASVEGHITRVVIWAMQ
ncbi:hypothetical protein B0J13DRAFT_570559 [Dactylonectria estremocensis]|uniref:SMP-30/Gluconolactonase/LRE-like region domain-containing protein n=1 Tax=Dactylonectria estremocensis TaxID=1079267 RepID=A0A9P9DEX4_9HYPO|nr:hypothetical protein B0J13DRAFT_570559 [Dactylonectria estremocensis]